MLGIVTTRTNLIRLMGFVIIALRNLSKLTIVNIQTKPMQHLVCVGPVMNRKVNTISQPGSVNMKIDQTIQMGIADLVTTKIRKFRSNVSTKKENMRLRDCAIHAITNIGRFFKNPKSNVSQTLSKSITNKLVTTAQSKRIGTTSHTLCLENHKNR